MKKSAPKKKHVSPIVTVAVIAAAVLVWVILWFTHFSRPKAPSMSDYAAKAQEFVNQGFQPPGMPRQKLEEMGVKYPANFDELAAKQGNKPWQKR